MSYHLNPYWKLREGNSKKVTKPNPSPTYRNLESIEIDTFIPMSSNHRFIRNPIRDRVDLDTPGLNLEPLQGLELVQVLPIQGPFSG